MPQYTLVVNPCTVYSLVIYSDLISTQCSLFSSSAKQKVADEKAIKRSEQEMDKIHEQMEVIVLSLIFLKNCYALIKICKCFRIYR